MAERLVIGQRSQAIVVLGMHRSGTSAVTRVVNLLGAELGQRLMPPMPNSNEMGFWENLDAVDVDERVLTGIGRSWHDVRHMPPGWLESAAADEGRAAIRLLVETHFRATPLWAVKDPRMCRLMPLWLPVLVELGVEPHILFVVRHPLDVAASLYARDGWPHTRSLLLWLQHVLEAEHATRGCRRVIVSYDQVLHDWSHAMGLVGQRLHLTWPRPVDDARAEIDAFLDVGSRHHERTSPASDASGEAAGLPPLVAEVFEQCVRACASESAWREIEKSSDAFHRFSALYGVCLDDFIGYANRVTGRVQHAGTIPPAARPKPGAVLDGARDVSRALAALTTEDADVGTVTRTLQLHAGLVERLGRTVEEQWARIASLEALLFAEHQSMRSVLAGESHRIRSAVNTESASVRSGTATGQQAVLARLETLRSSMVDEAQAMRSELKESAQLVREEVEKLSRDVAEQTDAIRRAQEELARVRRGPVVRTLRRWLRRSDG